MVWIAFLCYAKTNEVNFRQEFQDIRTPVLQASYCSPSRDHQVRFPRSLRTPDPSL
jgi:hypothetical protein